jgi:hypothetical protein
MPMTNDVADRGLDGRVAASPESEDRAVTEVPIDVSAKIILERDYFADEVVGRLKNDVIPQCFADAAPGSPIYQSEVLSRANATAGVRSVCGGSG